MPEPKVFKVYRLQENTALQDPAFAEKRYHTSIFVETNVETGDGFKHHVTGDIVSVHGMIYEVKNMPRPKDSETFHQMDYVGWVEESDYPDAMEKILRSIPTPPRQRRFSPDTMAYEQCKTNGEWYQPGETRPAYFKCTEWALQRAIPALMEGEILHADENERSSQDLTGKGV